MIEKFSRKLFSLIPESKFKNKFRHFYYNYLNNCGFKIHIKNGIFILDFKDFSLKFLQDPCDGAALTINAYMQNYKIKKGDIIVDAGAYIGEFSLIASKIVGGEGKVIAYEPDPENYK